MKKSRLLGTVFIAALALVLASTPALSATLIWSGAATTTGSDPSGNSWQWIDVGWGIPGPAQGSTSFVSPGFDVALFEVTFDSGTIVGNDSLFDVTSTSGNIWNKILLGPSSIRFEAPAGEVLSANDSFFVNVSFNDTTPRAFTACWSDGMACIYSTPVPVPAAAWLFGSGLLGLIGIARRKAV